MAKHSKGKHAASDKKNEAKKNTENSTSADADASVSFAAPPAPVPPLLPNAVIAPAAPAGVPQAAQPKINPDGTAVITDIPKKPRWHIPLIVLGVILIVLAAVYFAGVMVFSGRYLPNTYVAGTNYAFATPAEMRDSLDSVLDNYKLRVKGQGLDFTVTSDEADLASDTELVANEILQQFNPWKWPVELFQTRDMTNTFSQAISANSLSDLIAAEVDAFNAEARMPVNATTAFDEGNGAFVEIKEVPGTAIDAEVLTEKMIESMLNFQDDLRLDKEVLIQPEIKSDDPRVLAARDQANVYASADFDLNMNGNLVAHVGPALVASWISVSPELEVAFNDAALWDWAGQTTASCNTVGTSRSYTRPDGKQVSVSGGDYGWKVNGNDLSNQIIESVKSGRKEALEIPVSQGAAAFGGAGTQDWGGRYIDIDLSEQYARFYDGGGVIWESAIVSGNPNKGHSTPTGVYDLNLKASPQTLYGPRQPDGTYEYESKVTYWMPFKANSVGLHDATWQSSFGGSRYLSAGSHGCVNLPLSAAKSLYGIIKVGDVVVVHK